MIAIAEGFAFSGGSRARWAWFIDDSGYLFGAIEKMLVPKERRCELIEVELLY